MMPHRTALEMEREGAVLRLTLNRPERRNALSLALLQHLDSTLRAVGHDESVSVVVLAARGPVFCAGHDLGEMQARTEREYLELFATCAAVMLQLRWLHQPVIAQVQGPALAAGCQLVAACDLAVAASEATFSTPGVKIGLFCSTPMVPLVRAIPAKPALEMLLTGEPISAERALALGLVNRVVPAAELDNAVRQLVATIVDKSPRVIQLGKKVFYELDELSEEAAYRRAVAVMTANALLPDAQEGMAAFLEKRTPEWPALP
jgi:enoyl-CoA hydratase/carnithine racemase